MSDSRFFDRKDNASGNNAARQNTNNELLDQAEAAELIERLRRAAPWRKAGQKLRLGSLAALSEVLSEN